MFFFTDFDNDSGVPDIIVNDVIVNNSPDKPPVNSPSISPEQTFDIPPPHFDSPLPTSPIQSDPESDSQYSENHNNNNNNGNEFQCEFSSAESGMCIVPR